MSTVADTSPGLRAFTLELTKACNLRCGYCYYAVREDAYSPAQRMDKEVAEKSVDMLVKSQSSELHIHFFGGEPLLNFPVLAHTVLYAKQEAAKVGKTFTFEMTTNGTRFTDDVIEFLNEHKIRVAVSFDGPKELQDVVRPLSGGSSYALAEPQIRKFLASRAGTELELETWCSAVITRLDLDIRKIVRHFESLGFRKVFFSLVTDMDGSGNGIRPSDLPLLLEAYDELAADYEAKLRSGERNSVHVFNSHMDQLLSGKKRENFCYGGRDYLGVAADGKLNLCYRFYEDNEFGMGSVDDGVTRDVTERLLELPVEKKTQCSTCWARYFCGGGCHHENVTLGGSLGEPNPISCDFLRHNMSNVLATWGRLLRDGSVPQIKGSEDTRQRPLVENTTFDLSNDCPTKSPANHERIIENERVVYNPESHQVVLLNRTAGFILERCDGTQSVGELLRALEEHFAAPTEVLQSDLFETLSELRHKKIVA